MSSRVIEALELQIAEVEMLQSMYPNGREFVLDDPVTLEVVKAVVGGDLDSLETRLGFTIQISCDKGKVLSRSIDASLWDSLSTQQHGTVYRRIKRDAPMTLPMHQEKMLPPSHQDETLP